MTWNWLFKLQVKNVHPIFKDWMAATFQTDDYDARTLESLRIVLSINAQTWQEQELIMHFIAPLLFCVHEYKYAMRTENDPLGQLLAGMITAQKLNETNEYPMLGSYIRRVETK
jgi:hypothetical protein